MSATTVTNRQIRAYILRNPDHLKVTIKADGQILVRTNKRRGDGGPTPWTMYWGDRSDAVAMLETGAVGA